MITSAATVLVFSFAPLPSVAGAGQQCDGAYPPAEGEEAFQAAKPIVSVSEPVDHPWSDDPRLDDPWSDKIVIASEK
jgi:hypothetical protein